MKHNMEINFQFHNQFKNGKRNVFSSKKKDSNQMMKQSVERNGRYGILIAK